MLGTESQSNCWSISPVPMIHVLAFEFQTWRATLMAKCKTLNHSNSLYNIHATYAFSLSSVNLHKCITIQPSPQSWQKVFNSSKFPSCLSVVSFLGQTMTDGYHNFDNCSMGFSRILHKQDLCLTSLTYLIMLLWGFILIYISVFYFFSLQSNVCRIDMPQFKHSLTH